MSFTKQRFLINPLASVDNTSASSQGIGTIQRGKKTGTGTTVLTPSGSYTGGNDKLFTYQCDVAGTVGAAATIRWKTSDTPAGTWEATGVATTVGSTALGSEGVQVTTTAGTMVLNDRWQFWAYAGFGPANLYVNDRDKFWKSGNLDTLVSNGEFTSATTDWTATDATLASIAGGQSGNCLEITRTGGTFQRANQLLSGLVVGEKYRFSAYVKSGSSGDEAFIVQMSATPIENISGTSSATWTKYTSTFVATATTNNFRFRKDTATAGTMLFDTAIVTLIPSLEMDLGSALNVAVIVLADHNLSSAATVTLAANSSSSWSSPPYDNDILSGANSDPSVDYISETYQFLKFFFDDVENTDGYISIGKLYAGTYTEVASGQLIGGANWGPGNARNRTEARNVSDAGKAQAYVYSENEEFPLAYTWLNLTNLATLRTVWDYTATVSTGVKTSIWLHYWNDVEATMYLCEATSTIFDPTYSRGGSAITLNWRQEVMTRVI